MGIAGRFARRRIAARLPGAGSRRALPSTSPVVSGFARPRCFRHGRLAAPGRIPKDWHCARRNSARQTPACAAARFSPRTAPPTGRCTLPSTRIGAPASKLRRIANIAPVQDTAGARNIATGAPKPVQSCDAVAGYDAANASMGSARLDRDWISGAASLRSRARLRSGPRAPPRRTSAVDPRGRRHEAGRHHERDGDPGNDRVEPVGIEPRRGSASANCSAHRTAASTSIQPISVGRPTRRGSGVRRQIAARAAILNTDHTPAAPQAAGVEPMLPAVT